MANTYLNSTIITREIAMVMAEKLAFLKKINRSYDDQYSKTGAKTGDTLKVRLPSRGTVRTGRVMDIQDLVDRSVDLVIGNQWGIDLGATSADMSLKIDDFRERYIEPKIADLAAKIEGQVLADNLANVYQVAGNYLLLDNFDYVLEANQKLSDQMAPVDRTMFIGNKAERDAVNAFKAFFNNQTQIGKQYEDGVMGRAGGFDWYSSSLVPTYTRGTANGAYVTNGVGVQGATTLAVNTGAGTFTAGDVFTIAGVFAVHPQTKVSLGYLQTFSVTAASAGGAVTLSIAPALLASGPEQNISALPAGGAAITVKGVASTPYQENVAFAKDAVAFVTADLPLPPKKDASRVTYQGISLRYINDYDTVNDMFISRVDILWGSALIRPEQAIRIPTTL